MENKDHMHSHIYNTLRYRQPQMVESKADHLSTVQVDNYSLLSYVGWTDEDADLIRSARLDVENSLDHILDEFYNSVMDNEHAKNILQKAGSSVDILKVTLREWLADVFQGAIDEEVFEKQRSVGKRHVQVNLPQSYMVMGINIMRHTIRDVVCRKYKDDIDKAIKTVDAVNKSLDVRLSVMLRSYQDDRDSLLKDKVLSDNESILALGRMSASIAHEIKNPLAGINGAIQVLKEKQPKDSDAAMVMESVLEQVQRLSGTVKDLLDFARPVRLNLQKIRFVEIVDSLRSLLESDPHFEMSINVKDDGSAERELYVDPIRFQGVFYNLLTNANEAIEGQGVIELSSEEDKYEYRVFVSDNGPGIPADWVSELFKPFSTNKTHGTGLGLAICSKIIESHRGELSYVPQSRGACFCISLPKKPEEDENHEK